MNEFSFEEAGYPRIFTIHSQKGGVGKTSIALALAGITGARGKKTLIIDGDMTGASIADVPGMTCDGTSDFNKLILAIPNEFCAVTKTWPARKKNTRSELEKRFCKEQTDHKGVYVIPSSARAEDVERIVPLFSQEDHLHFFRNRIEDILAVAIQSGFDVIIMDHSPGMFGFSKANLQMCLEWALKQDKNDHRLGHLLKADSREPSLHALLVSSFDPHDYKSALTSFQHLIDGFDKECKSIADSFGFVFNKASGGSDSVTELGKMFSIIGDLSPYLTEAIRSREKEFGPQLAPFIEGFGMGDILPNAKNFVSQVKSGALTYGKWTQWFLTIACRARLMNSNDTRDAGIIL